MIELRLELNFWTGPNPNQEGPSQAGLHWDSSGKIVWTLYFSGRKKLELIKVDILSNIKKTNEWRRLYPLWQEPYPTKDTIGMYEN